MSPEAKSERREQAGSAAPVHEPFVRAFLDYKRALDDAMAYDDLQRRIAEADHAFRHASAEAVMPGDLRQQAGEAYRSYARAAQEATSMDELRERASAAFSGVREAAKSLMTPEQIQRRAHQAWTDYVRSVQAALAPEDLQERVRAANREYVSAVAQAWTQVDPGRLGLGAMTTIAQSLNAAAWLTAAAGPAIRQRWAAACTVTAASIAGAGRFSAA
jgi:hypothetical protein